MMQCAPLFWHGIKLKTLGGLRNDIQSIRSSGQYYVTHELDKELNNINDGVNHMRLDSDLINSSSEWGKTFDQQHLNREKSGELSMTQ